MENEMFVETIKQKIKEEQIEDVVDVKNWEFRIGDIKQEQNSLEFINGLHGIADGNFENSFHKHGKQENEDHDGEKEEMIKKQQNVKDLALKQEYDGYVIEEQIDIAEHKNDTIHTMHECAVCYRKYYRKHDLLRHIEVIHNQNDFECTICRNRFNQKHSLERHMKIIHNQVVYECRVCHKMFYYILMLDTHVRGFKFKCTICNETFNHQHSQNEREKAVCAETKYECRICNITFRLEENLCIHMKVVHDEMKVCTHDAADKEPQADCLWQDGAAGVEAKRRKEAERGRRRRAAATPEARRKEAERSRKRRLGATDEDRKREAERVRRRRFEAAQKDINRKEAERSSDEQVALESYFNPCEANPEWQNRTATTEEKKRKVAERARKKRSEATQEDREKEAERSRKRRSKATEEDRKRDAERVRRRRLEASQKDANSNEETEQNEEETDEQVSLESYFNPSWMGFNSDI